MVGPTTSRLRFHRIVMSGTVLCFALSACGGAGSSTSTPTLLGQGQAAAGDLIVPLSSSVSTAALPAAGGFGGTIAFPAIMGTASIDMSASTNPPAGILATARRPQSGTLSEFYYVSMTPSTTVTLPVLPSITLKNPQTYPSSGKQFYYALQLPSPSGVYQQFRTEGPGVVSGTSVTFGASAQPYTLIAGKKYTFAFYAISSNNTSAAKLLYVANAGNNSITAYALTAQGNTAPVRTIAGAATGLSQPSALAADTDGNLIVASMEPGNRTLVETFAEGASGNSAPIRTFSVPGPAANLSVDPSDGSIGVAFDVKDNLIVGGDDSSKNGGISNDEIFRHGATATTPPSYHIGLTASFPLSTISTAIAYARTADHIVTTGSAGTGDAVFDQQNVANAPILRFANYTIDHSTTTYSSPLLAVDDANQCFFIGDHDTSEIRPLCWTGFSAVPGALISGTNTGLSGPTSMTIAAP